MRKSVGISLLVLILPLFAQTNGSAAGPAPPDLDRIVFISARYGDPTGEQIYSIRRDGTEKRRLTPKENGRAERMWLQKSPDGKYYSFISYHYVNGVATTSLDCVSADGRQWTSAADQYILDCRPAWAPAGDRIAYVTARKTGSNWYVYVKVLRLADNSVSQLNTTVQDATDISSLRWSPDGKKLLCTIKRNYQQGCDIYVIDAEGGRVSNITRGMAAYDSISWSKDGKKILFSCDKDANSDVYLMNADGTGLINITQSRENELLPAWSPDGSGMAWLKFPPRIKDTWASAFDLCIADASGAATDIIPGFLGPEWSPLSSWAPDGGRMIVGTKNGDSYNLTLVDLRTKERTEFTNGRCEITYNYSSQYPENEGIRWLSDGSGIAFQGEGWGILSGDGSSDVFVCSFETMELTNCTRSDDPYLWYGFARTRQ